MATKIELRLNPETGVYDTGTLEASEQAPGELSQAGVFGGAAAFDFGGVPVGAAIIGGLSAGFFDALIGLFPVVDIPGVEIPTNIRRGILFFIASWASQTEPVRNFLGRDGAQATSLILAADGVREFINLRGIFRGFIGGNAVNQGSGHTPNQQAELAQLRAQLAGMGAGGLSQVPAIAQARQALAGL